MNRKIICVVIFLAGFGIIYARKKHKRCSHDIKCFVNPCKYKVCPLGQRCIPGCACTDSFCQAVHVKPRKPKTRKPGSNKGTKNNKPKSKKPRRNKRKSKTKRPNKKKNKKTRKKRQSNKKGQNMYRK